MNRNVVTCLLCVVMTGGHRVLGCDTWVAMPDATADGVMIMGKNSDVAAYECEPFVRWEGKTHSPEEMIDLQYQKIPQVRQTYTVLASKQFWVWGCEQGINEFGVSIGNESIYSKGWRKMVKKAQAGEEVERGILGMNLVRLGLERGRTAREALEAMTDLIEQYGQWGSGLAGFSDVDGSWDNSFLIADGTEAWVLEAVDKEWAARRVRKGVANIGNFMTIRREWDLSSTNMIKTAVQNGWWPAEKVEEFDFGLAYHDFETPLAPSIVRGKRAKALLKERQGSIDVEWGFRITRDHYEGTFLEGPYYNAAVPDVLTICMHHSPADFTWGITAGTNIFVLPSRDSGDIPVTFWAANVPCNSCFVPFYVTGSTIPKGVDRAGKSKGMSTDAAKTTIWGYTPDSYWWQFDKLRMLVNGDKRAEREKVIEFGFKYNQRQPAVRAEFDKLEEGFIAGDWKIRARAKQLIDTGKADEATKLLDDYSSKCATAALVKCKTLIHYFEGLND